MVGFGISCLSDIELGHDVIEVGQSVIWTQNVTFSNSTDSIAIEIPADAEILSIKSINATNKSIIFESKDYLTTENKTEISDGLYDDVDISEKDLKKYFRLLDSVGTIESKINETNSKIAYYANLDTAKAHKKLDKLDSKLDELEEKLDLKLDKLSAIVPMASLQQVDELLQEDKPLKVLLLNDTAENLELTFMTPAPFTHETDNSTNGKYSKKVTVAHDSALHYSNVTAFSPIPENLVSKDVEFSLFWNINGSKVDVTNDERFAVEFVDTDGNNIADQMQWIVPQLSEQEFDIEAEINIINVQSYPTVGGNWKVRFTTNGTADLIITASNGTTFGEALPDDLKFLELNNGTHTLDPEIDGQSIIYRNYTSTEEGFELSRVMTPGKHHIMFQFGNDTMFAHNSARVVNGPDAFLMHGTPNQFFIGGASADTDGGMGIFSYRTLGWPTAADRQDNIFSHSTSPCTSADSCDVVSVSEEGMYRINYGMTITQTTESRMAAIGFIQNDTDGTGGFSTSNFCYDGATTRSSNTIDTIRLTGECLMPLDANGEVRVGLDKVSQDSGTANISFEADENWFHIQKVKNPTVILREQGDKGITINSATPIDMTFESGDVEQIDSSVFFFNDTADAIVVKKDGAYRVTYSVFTDSFTGGNRMGTVSSIQTNSTGDYLESEYGRDTAYYRSTDSLDMSGMSASTILELTTEDAVKFGIRQDEAMAETVTANRYHLDMEYLGELSNVQILRLHDGAGGQVLDNTIQIEWDTGDEIDSDFTFTPGATATDITVEREGLYHVSYGIDAIDPTPANTRYLYHTSLEVNNVAAEACYGSGYTRGVNTSDQADEGSSESSCYIELDVGDVLHVESIRFSGTALGHTTVGDQTWITIQSLTLGDVQLETLTFTDVVETDVVKGRILTESVTLSDGTVETILAGGENRSDSLGFSDKLNKDVSLTLKESLGFADVYNQDAAASLEDSLTFTDVLTPMKQASVSLTDSLTFTDVVSQTASVSLEESLTFTDNISQSFAVSLEESLTFTDVVESTITISLTDSLTFTDNISQSFAISLEESLTFTDVAQSTIVVSLEESLTFTDVAQSTIVVSLEESLTFTDVVEQTITISLEESLTFTDAIETTISVSLTELLTFTDVAQSTIVVSLEESLTFTDVAQSTIVVSLEESLTFTDVVEQTIAISLTESLDFTDNVAKTFAVSLEELLILNDQQTNTFSVSLVESLTFTDVVDQATSVSLTESLTFTDDISQSFAISLEDSLTFVDAVDVNAGLSVSLVESLTFTDVASQSFVVSLTESLTFVDVVDTTQVATVSLTELLTFVDDINNVATVSLTESLTFVDVVDTTQEATVSLTDSLTFTDAIQTPHDATEDLTESLTFTPGVGQVVNIAPNQEIITDTQLVVVVTDDNTELIIADAGALLSSVVSTASDVSMNYTFIQTGLDVTITNGWTATSDIDASLPTFDVQLEIPDGTTMTGPAGWDGAITIPTFTSVTIPDTEDETFSEITAIEIGLPTAEITFDQPVRIEFTGDGGKDFELFFQRSGDASVTFIDTVCVADNLAAVDAQLAAGEECAFDDGSDLIIWTTHFTKFGSSRSTSTSSGGAGGAGPSAGAGGSSGGGGVGPAGGFAGILGTPLAINEVSYDKCDENMARILVSSDADEPPRVVLHTTVSGTVYATLAEEQPFADLNQFTSVDKYLYEAPIASDETFMMVVVSETKGDVINRVQSPVYLTSCTDSTTIVELPEEEEEVFLDAPRIFDVKFQIENGTSQRAEINTVSYLDGQDLTVTAIVDSKSTLARAELRTATLGQSVDEYIAIKMDIESMQVSNSTSFVSATIPSHIMVEPGVKYWIHIIDENLHSIDSKHYEFGIKPTTLSNVSVEMDMPTVRPTGASIKPEVYIFTDGAPVYGTVSLIANGEIVSEKAQFFEIGQTKVTFDWDIPKSDSYTSNELQGKVDLYDSSIITESATIHSHPRTTSVSSSQLPSLELIEVDGHVVAEPALIYSSNSDENLQFRVIDPQGQCVIGGTDDCTINESTKGNRGGLTSIMYGDQVLRVKYSGADNALERFSITSIDPITGQWTVSVENEEGFIQQAHAVEDIDVKVKYRYHSETITAFSN